MIKIIKRLNNLKSNIEEHEMLNVVYRYYKSKEYMNILFMQMDQLINNLKSIEALLAINHMEDAYTIFRKYLETYFILMSVFEHPDTVNKYLEHDKMLAYKACGKNSKDIKQFTKNKIDGYLQYGYLEDYLAKDINKITMYDVAKAAHALDLHNIYKKCNNFVHNNMNYVKYNVEEGIKVLKINAKKSVDILYERFNKIEKGK